jgi:hypothetical protein
VDTRAPSLRELRCQLLAADCHEELRRNRRLAQADADQQTELVKAKIAMQTSQQRALANKNEGQGEKDRLRLVAEGQKSQAEVLGVAKTVNLQKSTTSCWTRCSRS